ncbi:PnuC-like nicotinamide riboside transporter [Arthrobacter phage Wilde]|uniref:PnuC-like nicotinamide riboside transporter n=1 Tax=Arthrobacter phage Wilde TaxID=1772323 RepID=A0A0U4JR15_9CAUD|nr:PnuC-like nicotinamide riboside transporter [Arthrobacter phage Wilde]
MTEFQVYSLVWSIALSVIGLTGLYFAGNKSQLGWAIGLSVQVLWIIFAITTTQWGFILSALGYGLMNLRNWRKWRADKRKSEHAA